MNIEQMQKFSKALLKIEELEKRVKALESKKRPKPKRPENVIRQSNS